MSTSQFGVFLIIVFIIAIILRIGSLKKSQNAAEKTEEENLNDPMQDLFFSKVSNGAEKIHLLNLSGTNGLQDLIVLKNLMQSENIPYYSEFEKFNAVYGGLITSIKFYILKDDYEKAVPLVKQYQKNSPNGVVLIDS